MDFITKQIVADLRVAIGQKVRAERDLLVQQERLVFDAAKHSGGNTQEQKFMSMLADIERRQSVWAEIEKRLIACLVDQARIIDEERTQS